MGGVASMPVLQGQWYGWAESDVAMDFVHPVGAKD